MDLSRVYQCPECLLGGIIPLTRAEIRACTFEHCPMKKRMGDGFSRFGGAASESPAPAPMPMQPEHEAEAIDKSNAA